MPRSHRASTRPGRAQKSTTRRRRPAALEHAFAMILQSAGGLGASPDPLPSEMFVSQIVGTLGLDPSADPPAVEVGATIVGQLVAARTPDAMAILLALGSLANATTAEQARFATRRVAAEGVAVPAWVDDIGRPAFVEAWSSVDEFDDQELVIASYRYANAPAHGIVTMFDRNFNGLVRQAWIGPDPTGIRDSWTAESGLAAVPVDAQHVADALANGLRWYVGYLDPPVYEDVPPLAALLRSRLRCLPAPREIEVPEVSARKRRSLVAAFRKSPEAAGFADADLAEDFINFACDYGAGDPLRWSPIAIEMCLLDWYPRKITIDDRTAASVPEAMRRWVRFAAGRKGLSAASLNESLEAIDRFEPQYLAAMKDSDNFGPAKSLFLEMTADSLDLTDERAVQAWIDARNRRRSG